MHTASLGRVPTGSSMAGSVVSHGRRSLRAVHCNTVSGTARLSRVQRSDCSSDATVTAAEPDPRTRALPRTSWMISGVLKPAQANKRLLHDVLCSFSSAECSSVLPLQCSLLWIGGLDPRYRKRCREDGDRAEQSNASDECLAGERERRERGQGRGAYGHMFERYSWAEGAAPHALCVRATGVMSGKVKGPKERIPHVRTSEAHQSRSQTNPMTRRINSAWPARHTLRGLCPLSRPKKKIETPF